MIFQCLKKQVLLGVHWFSEIKKLVMSWELLVFLERIDTPPVRVGKVFPFSLKFNSILLSALYYYCVCIKSRLPSLKLYIFLLLLFGALYYLTDKEWPLYCGII